MIVEVRRVTSVIPRNSNSEHTETGGFITQLMSKRVTATQIF